MGHLYKQARQNSLVTVEQGWGVSLGNQGVLNGWRVWVVEGVITILGKPGLGTYILSGMYGDMGGSAFFQYICCPAIEGSIVQGLDVF